MSVWPSDETPWYRGAALAVIDGDARWDYSELAARAVERAVRLTDQGLAAGDAVLVVDNPGADFLVTQHALWLRSAGILPVSASLAVDRRAELLATAGVEWQLRAAAPGAPRLVATGFSARAGASTYPFRSPLAAIIETSGTSGSARAALLTQEAMLASCRLSNRRLGLGVGDRWLCCLPRHHVGGLMIGLRCALAGAAVVVQRGFDAGAMLAALARERVTHVSLVPPMLSRVLAVGARPPSSLRVALIGGQALHPTLAEQAIALGWPLCVTYGMTETCSQVATSGLLVRAPEAGVIGPPLPGIEVDCPPAEAPAGPIRIRGPVVMAGYARPDRLPGLGLDAEGWLTTSDLGHWTASGALEVMGRADDALVIGGHNVLPSRVEGKLLEVPGVSAAVVIGIEELVWGHSLVAVYTGSTDIADLERWCREQLPSHERPRQLRRVAQLPVLSTGKYDRALIRAWLTTGTGPA